jgi:uncharacterized RDD family membrane protein YckC
VSTTLTTPQITTIPQRPLEPAGWWSRVGATILDGIAVLLLSGMFALLGLIVRGESGASTAFVIAYFALLVLYAPIMLFVWDGQTLGKRAVGIRVIRLDQSSIGFWRAALREFVVKWLLSFTIILYWLAALWPLWNDLHRAWWDYAAGTRVVVGGDVVTTGR